MQDGGIAAFCPVSVRTHSGKFVQRSCTSQILTYTTVFQHSDTIGDLCIDDLPPHMIPLHTWTPCGDASRFESFVIFVSSNRRRQTPQQSVTKARGHREPT